MKKLLIVLLAVVLFSCSKEDEPKPYQNPIVEGCECGIVTGYDIRTLSGTTYYYLDYKRDCDGVIKEVQTDYNTWINFHSGDEICWE